MADIQNPWDMAEKAVFERLLSVTGSVEGKNAFRGMLPPYGNAWSFKMGGGGNERNTWGGGATELKMDADIEAIFHDREEAMLFGLKVVRALPIRRIANVQTCELRPGGMPDVRVFEVELKGDRQPRMMWTCPIGLDVVFNLTDRPNVAPNA